MDVIAGTNMTLNQMSKSDTRDWIMENMKPDLPAQTLAYLVHDSCTANGEFIAGGGKGFTRYFWAGLPGFSTEKRMTPEIVRNNFSSLHRSYDGFLELENANTVAKLVAMREGTAPLDHLDEACKAEET